MDYINKVASRLSEEVKKKGMSTRDLEEKTGISRSTISRYMSGNSGKIPLSKLQLIANALNVISVYLACWTDDPYFTLDEESERESSPVETDELKILIDSLSEEKKKQLEQYAKFLLSQED